MTHLGNIIKPGDICAGYDLTCAQFNDEALESYQGLQLPEVILVKKGESNMLAISYSLDKPNANVMCYSKLYSLQEAYWPPHFQAQEPRR